jgi:hypothetical protein
MTKATAKAALKRLEMFIGEWKVEAWQGLEAPL